DGEVSAVAVQTNGAVIIVGQFSFVNGAARKGIARLQTNGVVDPSFNPGSGFDAGVWAVAIQPNGQIVVGGDFSTINFAPRSRIARLNFDGSLDNSFVTPGGIDGAVRSIALQPDGRVLLGGDFTSISNTNRARIARLDDHGGLDLSFDPGTGANSWVYAVGL